MTISNDLGGACFPNAFLFWNRNNVSLKVLPDEGIVGLVVGQMLV